MKCFSYRVSISALCLLSFFSTNASQELMIKLVIDKSRCFRRDSILPDQLDKWGRFYGQEAPPFEYYFPVVSARYEDCLSDDIILHKDLTKKLPSIIRNDKNLNKDERKKYFFPEYISEAFIEQLQLNQTNGKVFKHKFYKHRDLKKKLIISYTFEYQEQINQSGAENADIIDAPVASKPYQNQVADYVVDLMALLSLFIG